MLPDQYRITRQDLKAAGAVQKTELRQGDIVLIRTGRMKLYNDPAAYMAKPPGMGLDAARYLVEEGGAMILGADNLSFETFPSEVADDTCRCTPICWRSRACPSLSWPRWMSCRATRSTSSPSSAAR